jgi:hypothetical protein
MNICAVPVPSNGTSSSSGFGGGGELFPQVLTLSTLLAAAVTPNGGGGLTAAVAGDYELVPSRICGEHGTCVASPESVDDFACVCESGFAGRYCHISECWRSDKTIDI